MSGPQLVIKQQKPFLWYFSWGAAAVAVLLVTYFVGRYHAKAYQQELSDKTQWLQQELDKYQLAYQKANDNLVMQEQSAKVDNLSSQQLVETVKQMQSVQHQLESELKFYRNIMAPELDKQGLNIAEFELHKASPEGKPQFKLVLTQVGKQDQFLKGIVDLKLHGELNGQKKVYGFRELGTFQPKHFQFQFRYFQNIEGELALPEGFTAEFVIVQAKTRGLKKNQSTQKQVNWTI